MDRFQGLGHGHFAAGGIIQPSTIQVAGADGGREEEGMEKVSGDNSLENA